MVLKDKIENKVFDEERAFGGKIDFGHESVEMI